MRERISFFRSWYQALKVLPEEQRMPFLEAILSYGFEGVEPSFQDPMMRAMWLAVRPIVDSSNARIDGGSKGGARSKKATLQASLQATCEATCEATSTSYLDKLPSEATLVSYPFIKEKEKEKEKEKSEGAGEDNPPMSPQGEVSNDTVCTNAREKKSRVEPKTVKFAPPTVDDVQAYLKEKGITDVNAEEFVAHYESNGWKVGRNPMKSWRAAITTWRRNSYAQRSAPRPTRAPNPWGEPSVGTAHQRPDIEIPDVPIWD